SSDLERLLHHLTRLRFNLFEYTLGIDVEEYVIANPSTAYDTDVKLWKVFGVLPDFGFCIGGMNILIPQNAALFKWIDRDDLQPTVELPLRYLKIIGAAFRRNERSPKRSEWRRFALQVIH